MELDIPYIRATFTEERLRGALAGSGIPPYMHDGHVMYIRHGIAPGHFLTAVLRNDLAEACARADDKNARALYQHVRFLYAFAPRASWGGPQSFEFWVRSFQASRERESRAAEMRR